MSTPLPSRQIWGQPILLGLFSGVGLLAALLGDGLWDAVSWATLTYPCLVILRYLVRPIRRV